MKLTCHLPETTDLLLLMGGDFSFDMQWILAFLFCGEGIVQRNIEGIAPFLNTRFPEKVVLTSDVPSQPLCFSKSEGQLYRFITTGNKEYIAT